MKTKLLLFLAAFSFLFNSCIKDESFRTYTITRPEYSIKELTKKAAKVHEPIALKNPGNFVLYNNTMYLNEKGKGIHVIDYSVPSNPVNKGFIPVPGNQGLSIKNDVLYADCYCDLFVFKIHSTENIEFKNSVENVFLSRMSSNNYDTTYVKVTWIKKDTTVSTSYYDSHYNNCINCDVAFNSSSAQIMPQTLSPNFQPGGGGTSVGSSMAVFTIVGDYLYTVDFTNLNTFSLKDALNPVSESKKHVGGNIETIFPFKDKLFIGSMNGMFIYSLDVPSSPSYISQFNHVRVCDPVIADDKYAFVTLRNGSNCGGLINQMDILDISDIQKPTLVRSYNFSNPHGLSKDGKVLFLCDGAAGLKVLDVSDVQNVQTKLSLPIGNARDVVAYNQKAFVMLDESIKIYSYDQQFNVQLLGSINKN